MSNPVLFILSVDTQREFSSRPGTGYVPVEFWKKTGTYLSASRSHILTNLCEYATHVWGKGGCLLIFSSELSAPATPLQAFTYIRTSSHITLQVKNLE